MHEMGIALQIVQVAVDSIPPDMEGSRISAVNVEIGSLSTIVPESLTFCFELAAEETCCSGAALVIKNAPAVMKCNDCNTEWETDEVDFQCPDCGSLQIQALKNTDIDLVSISIDD